MLPPHRVPPGTSYLITQWHCEHNRDNKSPTSQGHCEGQMSLCLQNSCDCGLTFVYLECSSLLDHLENSHSHYMPAVGCSDPPHRQVIFLSQPLALCIESVCSCLSRPPAFRLPEGRNYLLLSNVPHCLGQCPLQIHNSFIQQRFTEQLLYACAFLDARVAAANTLSTSLPWYVLAGEPTNQRQRADGDSAGQRRNRGMSGEGSRKFQPG